MYVKYHEICRVCDGILEPFLTLPLRHIEGAFLTKNKKIVSKRKLSNNICYCTGECKLVQSDLEVPPEILYNSYFYKSDLAETMKRHLSEIAKKMQSYFTNGDKNPKVADIGGNNNFLLNQFDNKWKKFNIDPSDLSSLNSETITVINKCFPCNLDIDYANLILSIACFYDCNQPNEWVKEIAKLLRGGIWLCEIAYWPLMMERLMYDQLVMEHVTHYSLASFEYLIKKHNLRVFDAEINEVNGGSIQLYVTNDYNTTYDTKESKNRLQNIRVKEFDLELDSKWPCDNFAENLRIHSKKIRNLLLKLKENGKTIAALGASTKLNLLLDLADIGPDVIPVAVERDEEKIGGRTLNGIRIISEIEAKKLNFDYYFVGPHHFKTQLLDREKEYLDNGGKIIFSLPETEIHSKDGIESIV